MRVQGHSTNQYQQKLHAKQIPFFFLFFFQTQIFNDRNQNCKSSGWKMTAIITSTWWSLLYECNFFFDLFKRSTIVLKCLSPKQNSEQLCLKINCTNYSVLHTKIFYFLKIYWGYNTNTQDPFWTINRTRGLCVTQVSLLWCLQGSN